VIASPVLAVLAAVVGCAGGIYGIGSGSILAPVLIGSGRPAAEVAPGPYSLNPLGVLAKPQGVSGVNACRALLQPAAAFEDKVEGRGGDEHQREREGVAE